MTWFEVGAGVVVALAVLDGLASGLLWALLETAVLAASALLARQLGPAAEPYLLKVASLPPDDLAWVTYVLLFAALAAGLFGLLLLLQPAARRFRFRGDRASGGAVGALNGALASLVLFCIATWAAPGSLRDELYESRLTRSLDAALEVGLGPLLPAGARAEVDRVLPGRTR